MQGEGDAVFAKQGLAWNHYAKNIIFKNERGKNC